MLSGIQKYTSIYVILVRLGVYSCVAGEPDIAVFKLLVRRCAKCTMSVVVPCVAILEAMDL
jgi:hypothetical protein